MIKSRKLRFDFTDDLPFWLDPRNAEASQIANNLSLMAPAFERYFIKAIRDALPRIRGDAAREEANRFCMHEGQHAKFHIDHQNLLLRKRPQLEATRDEINRSYADLYRDESTEFVGADGKVLWMQVTENDQRRSGPEVVLAALRKHLD